MASSVSKVRFVRCPKCRQVLTELPDIPVYQCGGCNTVLRAKNRNADRGSVTSVTLESISSQNNLLEHDSEGAEQTSIDGSVPSYKETTLSSRNGITPQMDTGTDKMAALDEGPSHAKLEYNSHRMGESSENGEDGSKEIFSDFNSTRPAVELTLSERNSAFMDQSQPDQSAQAKVSHCLDEQMDCSLELEKHGSDNLRSRDKVVESIDDSVASEEDSVARALGDRPGHNIRSPTTKSSHAYEGSISSNDDGCNDRVPNRYRLLSKRTFRAQKVLESTSNKEMEGGEVTLVNNKMGTDSEAQIQGTILSSKVSNERYGSAVMGSIDLNQEDPSSIHKTRAYGRETSQDSEDFHSVENWMGSEKDVPSRSLSKDSLFRMDLPTACHNGGPMDKSRYLEHDREEILRKVDELRDQITRSYGQQGEGNRRSYIRGTRRGNWRPLFYNNVSEQENKCSHSSIPQNSSRAPGPRNTEPQAYQFSLTPFTGRVNFSCLHCHPEDWQVSIKLPPRICCHKGLCRACPSHMCCDPSSSTSLQCHMDSNLSACCHNTQTPEQDLEKVCKEKCQTMKCHCRPVSGGAPFVICYNCLQLLQLPADFLILRRRYHKLRCGACSKVLIFLWHDRAHIVPHSYGEIQHPPSEVGGIVPHSYAEIQHPPSEVGSSMDVVPNHEIPMSHINKCLQGDPVSYSEEYGLSFEKSYSTEGEPVLNVSRNSPETMKERNGGQRKCSPLHRLMGYSSASEIIYQPGDGDEGYESTDRIMGHFHRTSEEIHVIKRY